RSFDHWSLAAMGEILDQASYALDMIFDRVIHGNAPGVDLLADAWAVTKGYPVTAYPALWKKYGKRAGVVRSLEMVKDCDAAILVWDGESKGTRHTLDMLIMAKKPFVLVRRDPRRFVRRDES